MKEGEIIQCLGELHETSTIQDLIRWAANDLAKVFNTEFSVWTEFDGNNRLRCAELGHGTQPEVWKYGAAVQHFAPEDHSLFRQFLAENRRRQAGKLSDYASQYSIDETGLYREAYRHIGSRFQLGLFFSMPDGVLRTLAFGRDSLDYSDAQVNGFREISRHLEIAYRRMTTIETLTRQTGKSTAARWKAIRSGGHWYFAFADENAIEVIGKHFGSGREKFMVPPELARHLERISESSVSMLVQDHQGKLWTLEAEGHPFQDFVVLLTPKKSSEDPAAELTRREKEVGKWLAEGKSNNEMGLVLGISSKTVEKHVENLFRKLGVNSRVAAVRRLLSSELI